MQGFSVGESVGSRNGNKPTQPLPPPVAKAADRPGHCNSEDKRVF